MKGPLNGGGGGAYIKWNGPIDLTDNSFDIKSNTCIFPSINGPFSHQLNNKIIVP